MRFLPLIRGNSHIKFVVIRVKKIFMKCLAFDLGRVLFDFDYSIALNKIKDKIGVSPEKIIHDLFYNDFAADFEKGLVSGQEFYRRFADEFRAQIEYEEFIEAWCDIFTPKYEIIDLVDRLRAIYPVYLISNINALHFDFLHKKYPQVFSLFDDLILSFRIKSLKPEKAIYAELKKISGKNYEQITYIDDREDLITQAKELNLNCIMFHDYKKLTASLQASDILIPDDHEKHTLFFLKNTINSYKKPLIVGLGNTLRADDGIGTRIVDAIREKTCLETLSAGGSFENYLGSVGKNNNDLILIIDAAQFPDDRSFAYFLPDDINNISLHFTHDSSLKLAVNYLQNQKAFDILILGIKAYAYDLSEELSEPIGRTKKILENFFLRNFVKK